MKQMKKQQGFTIVVVLLLSMMASVVVISSLKDTTMQERLSGNFEKQTNARLAAESGLFSTNEYLNSQLNALPASTLDDLIASKGVDGKFSYEAINMLEGMLANVELSKTSDGFLSVTSGGKRYEGEKKIRAFYELVPSAGNSLYPEAIIGCKGASYGASGGLESYHSQDSTYNGNDANVKTIIENADIKLKGSGSVKGDITSTGSIEVASTAVIEGDLWANFDITFMAGGSTSSRIVNGNVLALQDVIISQSTVNGYIRAKNLIELHGGVVINNNSAYEDVLYGVGKLGTTSTYINNGITKVLSESSKNTNLKIPKVETLDELGRPVPTSKECDPLQINTMNPLFNDSADSLVSKWGNVAVFTEKTANYAYQNGTNSGSLPIRNIDSSNLKILNSTYDGVYFFNDFLINGGDVKFISSDGTNKKIAVLVAGNFNLKALQSQAFISKNVSLSFYVQGRIEIRDSATVEEPIISFPNEKLYALNFFSANNQMKIAPKDTSCASGTGEPSNYGVYISSAAEINATIYAPDTNVHVGGSGVFSGSMRGGTVQNCGTGTTRFDVALRNIGGGVAGNSSPKLVFKGWRYHAESEEEEASSK